MRRAVVAVVATMAGAAGGVVGAGPVGPAGAQPAPITVEPSTGLVDGQTVTVTINAPGEFVVQCDAEVGDDPTLDEALFYCGGQETIAPDERPAVLQYVVRSSFSPFNGPFVDCGLEPGDCVIAIVSAGAGDFASAPITLLPPPFTATPTEALPDGGVVDLTAGGTPGDTVTAAQCASPVGPTLGESRCGPPVELVIGADGRARGTLTVTFVVETAAGPLDCQSAACAVAGFGPAGLIRAVPIAMQQPLSFSVGPPAGLFDGAYVFAEVRGHRFAPLGLYQCPAGTGPEDIGACTSLGAELPAGSANEGRPVAVAASYTSSAGDEVACADENAQCVVAAGSPASGQWVTAPITFARVTVVPASTGLLDGQPITLSAAGLLPGVAHRVLRCDPTRGGPFCEVEARAPVVTSDDQGTLEFETTAASRFTSVYPPRGEYCRDECTFQLRPDAPAAWYVTVPFAMAEGSLTASPDSGLSGGDTVTLTGTDLMGSYAGPPFWFFPSTGTWGVGQCAAGVLDDPTILGFFTHCTVASPGTVDVPGSTATVGVPAAASFTSILGEEVDCTAGPGACALVLARIEQDGSVSVHAAPVSFA